MKEIIFETIKESSDGLKLLKDNFFIIGSSALIMFGIEDLKTNDIDILTTKEDALILDKFWNNRKYIDYKSPEPELFRSAFSRYKFNKLDLEIMGGLEVCKDKIWTPLPIKEYNLIPINGLILKIPTLREQIKIFSFFGRTKDMQKIKLLNSYIVRS